MRRSLPYLLLPLAAGLVLLLGECHPKSGVTASEYLNLHDSVDYVGMQTCRSCHANVYDTYIRTGMGRSFGRALPGRSSADFGKHVLVYDSIGDLYYHPFYADSSLYIREFRLQGSDTVHNRLEKVNYIVGSGHHTHSHIIDRNGYLYQAPITFYTQDRRWDLAPGFENGANSRFTRILTTECITCHNHLPGHVPGSENRYHTMPEGIECERCHGPGELHVKAMLAGETVDTSKVADRTIINPRRLPRELQTDICQRCHLQGVTVLNPGKTFFDFRPGMALSDVMQVYLPRYTDSDERFIMASQADRLRMSRCYLQSEEMTCITCHHPHIPVAETGAEKYNSACRNCHVKQRCSAPAAERKAKGDDCSGCHMPKTGSIDIPHVRITDHYIRKDYRKAPEKSGKGRFLGLQPLTKAEASPAEMAEGYLALFDKFVADPAMLDSANRWLALSREKEERLFPLRVHLAFARQDYIALSGWGERQDTAKLDAWTAYRLGEGLLKTGKVRRAEVMLTRAVSGMPHHLDFLEKLGLAKGMNGRTQDAERIFRQVLLADEARPLALTNLGYLRAISGDLRGARIYYQKALSLDPDHRQAKENLAALEAAAKSGKER